MTRGRRPYTAPPGSNKSLINPPQRRLIRQQYRVREGLRTTIPPREVRALDAALDAAAVGHVREIAADGDPADGPRGRNDELEHRRALRALVAALRLRGGSADTLLEIVARERRLVELGLRLLL